MNELALGNLAIFLGYADRCAQRIEFLKPGKVVKIGRLEGEGAASVVPVDDTGHPVADELSELAWEEELLMLSPGAFIHDVQKRIMINRQDARVALTDLLEQPGSKLFKDIRNRAAFVHVTGIHPTHLRSLSNSFLVVMTEPAGDVPPLGGSGSVRLSSYYFDKLDLDSHPMVETVRDKLRCGWQVCAFTGPNSRASFQRVLIRRGDDEEQVQFDGSVRVAWSRG